MTSLSAIIFLVSARWRIVTASIMSEWEQGGVGIAAAYSTIIIVLVLIAIGVLYFVTRQAVGRPRRCGFELGRRTRYQGSGIRSQTASRSPSP